jgi:hypothetical protein
MYSVVLDGGEPEGEVGHFQHDVATDTWSWSEGFYSIHGYVPGEVPATTAVLLSHKHPDDRERGAAIIQRVMSEGGPFSHYHRIVDLHERVRSVLSVGHGLPGEDGTVQRVEGFMVDLTAARRNETEAEVQAHLARITEHRAVIDQAKGMVMLDTGCEGDAAFDQLRQCSHHANLKLHEVARRLVQAVEAGGHGTESVMAVLVGIVEASRHAAPEARR